MTLPIKVYLAARSEDQGMASELAWALTAHGIGITASWLAQDLSTGGAQAAMDDLDDIATADVFVLLNHACAHRNGTGGRHFESGVAFTLGKPLILVGEPEHVFHRHPRWFVVGAGIAPAALAHWIRTAYLGAAFRGEEAS